MATLPERLRRLEEVVLGSAATGALLSRVGQLEVCCLGSEAAGHLPQRLSKLEEVTGCAAGAGNDVEVAPQAVPLAVEEVPNAAASSQVSEPELLALPAAKRRRCKQPELRKDGDYQLAANAGSAARNPKAFKVHPLREEQLRSLAWMYSREAHSGFKGGLLADKMGYGKTATTIGLLSEKPCQVPDERPSGYIRNPATLVLCPPHLVEQWEDEFFKFLGDQVQLVHPCAVLAKDKKTMVLPPMEFSGSWLFTAAGDTVSELSPKLRLRNAALVPEKRLQVGDQIGSMRITLKPGEFFLREDLHGHLSRTNTITEKYGFQRLLDQNCRPGCTVEVTVVRQKKPRTKPVRGDGPFRILTIANSHDWRCLQLGDLLEAFNVVLVSTGVLGSQTHRNWLSDMFFKWALDGSCSGKAMSARQEKLHECVDHWHEKDSFLQAALRSAPAFLESMWWNRIVLDEFHESESWQSSVREVMKSLGATHRWGLSGTPPLDETDSVLEVAELLWYADGRPILCEALKNKKKKSLEAKSWWADPANKQKEACQAMIRDVVRQNSSALVEAIRVQEHEDFVQFSAEERLIYRQACHDHDIFDVEQAYHGATITAREALLKRCAHFCLDADAQDAGEAVRFLGRDKRARIQRLQQQLEIEATRAAHLSIWETAKHALLAEKTQHAEAEQFIHGVYRTSDHAWKAKDPEQKCFEMQISLLDRNGVRRLRPEVHFQQPIRDTEVYPRLDCRHVVQHAVARKCKPEAGRILTGMQVCAQIGCGDPRHLPVSVSAGFQALARLLDAAYRSLDFYSGQMRGLSDVEKLCSEQCSVCLTPMDDVEALVMLPCAHIFHRECVREVLETNPKCPYCRTHAPRKSMSSVVLEAEVANSTAETLPPELRSHGSKLLAVARRLQKIRAKDVRAKAIVFVQWQELEDKVARALQGHGLPVLQLPRGKNSGREMAAVMKSFTTSQDAFVLLLSLEHAASGSNLTAANHVIFVHPMNAETLSTAVAYERQALARVRRVGQERPEVHVWRFVTRETVEEHMHQLHCGAERAEPPDEARAAGA